MNEQDTNIAAALKLTKRRDPLVDKYEGRSTESLAGSAGGIGGCGLILCFWALGFVETRFAVALATTAAALGRILMLLIFRGPAQWRRDRSRKALKDELKYLREERNALKNVDGPTDDVKSELWEMYRQEIRWYRRQKRNR